MSDKFYGMSRADAVAFILHERGASMKTAEIVAALTDFKSLARCPQVSTQASLRKRAKAKGDIEKIGPGLWAPKNTLSPPRKLTTT